jgi:hypothetical protein
VNIPADKRCGVAMFHSCLPYIEEPSVVEVLHKGLSNDNICANCPDGVKAEILNDFDMPSVFTCYLTIGSLVSSCASIRT